MKDKRGLFRAVSSKVDFPQLEADILQQWRDLQLVDLVDGLRSGAPLFVFYEGPPTANGSPGIHHVLSRAFKDVILRYKTMKGYRPVRKAGWDTHGLPVELEIEKDLGISSKQEIENYGIERFNELCRASVFKYVKEWEALTERAGVWIDMRDPYVTYHNSYIENGWWIFKQLWDRGLVYEGNRVTPHCPRCVTSLSSHEVALGYQENTLDPSVFVRFPVKLGSGTTIEGSIEDRLAHYSDSVSIAVWTTTPWTLTANTAVAVNPSEDYVLTSTSRVDTDEFLLVASRLVEDVLGPDSVILESFKGSELVGLAYQSPFDTPGLDIDQYRIIPADYVTTADGTGFVHVAPAYGAEDGDLGRKHGLPTVHTVDLRGAIVNGFPGSGKFIKDADIDIIHDLDRRGLLLRSETYSHTYPFCWRCNTPLLYYAKTSWYIRTTAVKDQLVARNAEINWHPSHIKEGRFGEWLRNNVDWAVSRERYWGTPIPVWRCSSCSKVDCVGSVAELTRMATPETLPIVDTLDLHRPYVDQILLQCTGCGGQMFRIPEVADAWYDSGAMPLAQWTYPVDLPSETGAPMTIADIPGLINSPYFPAEFITEAVDQTRGWFYSLLALSTMLTDAAPYRNVICLGLILDENGEKMSKSRGNVVDPWAVLDSEGADALRWYLYTSAFAGSARRFSGQLVQESLRRFLMTLWNTYSFFVTYANIDGFDPDDHQDKWNGDVGGPSLRRPLSNELDRWIISELNDLVLGVTGELDDYNPTDAGRRIEEFVDLLSNWYVRRSRRRFWKSENDEDKSWAYVTLYSSLLTLSRLMAPLAPFIADEMFRNLTRLRSTKSVHLADYPIGDQLLVDETLDRATRYAMRIASLGRAARSKSNVKVRQPLSRILVRPRAGDEMLIDIVRDQVIDELNVKELQIVTEDWESSISVKPNLRVLGPKYGDETKTIISAMQNADPVGISKTVEAGGSVTIGDFTLQPDEIIVEFNEKEGISVMTEEGSGLMVAVDVTMTDSLRLEGVARELVHRIQNMRRSAEFQIDDRIEIFITGETDLITEVTGHYDSYIRQETLSRAIRIGEQETKAYVESHDIEGASVTIAVMKV